MPEPQTFDQWWEQTYADSNACGIDYTFGEEVWGVAQAAVVPPSRQTYDQWWEAYCTRTGNPLAENRGLAEEAWNAARKE